MARTSKAATSGKTLATTAAGNKSIALVDQELANEVANLKNQIGQASGNKIKVEATGDFVLPDGMNLGNEIQVVVVDFVTRNSFYSGPYNPNNPTPPDCYSIGKNLADLAPEADSPAIQGDKCATCPLNQYGSGDNGKSKACKNSRSLAVILVDPEDPDASAALDAPIYTLDLPRTAIKSFDGAVAYIARSLAGPPVKAVLTVSANTCPQPGFSRNRRTRPESSVTTRPSPDGSGRRARHMVTMAPRSRWNCISAVRSTSVSPSPEITRKGSSRSACSASFTLPAVPMGSGSVTYVSRIPNSDPEPK